MNPEWSDLHDAKLVNIKFGEMQSVTLSFVLETGAKRSLCFREVRQFLCQNLLEGNIVAEIDLVSDVNVEELQRMFGNTGVASLAFWKGVVEGIKSNDWKLVRLTCSYGCDVSVLCREILLFGD